MKLIDKQDAEEMLTLLNTLKNPEHLEYAVSYNDKERAEERYRAYCMSVVVPEAYGNSPETALATCYDHVRKYAHHQLWWNTLVIQNELLAARTPRYTLNLNSHTIPGTADAKWWASLSEPERHNIFMAYDENLGCSIREFYERRSKIKP